MNVNSYIFMPFLMFYFYSWFTFFCKALIISVWALLACMCFITALNYYIKKLLLKYLSNIVKYFADIVCG